MKPITTNNLQLEQLTQHSVWDVIIVGSGPASSSAAIVLAEKGWSVLVLEQQQQTKNRYGESLPPAVVSLVRQLLGDINEQQYADFGIKATPGNQSSWADDSLDTYDFISQPGGHGLCVNRQQFDAALQQRAQQQGASLVTGCRFLACQRLTTADMSYEIKAQLAPVAVSTQVAVSPTQVTLRSRFIIDASGRHAAVAKAVGVRTTRHDKLQAFVQHYHSSVCHPGSDFTLLEASEQGWWYSNLLPDGQNRVVVFHTDLDLAQAKQARQFAGFNQLLKQTKHVAEKLEQGQFVAVGDIKSTAANSQVAGQFVKDQVLLVGDAAMAFDPLSSQGMMKAMQNGNKAGQLIAYTLEDLTTESPEQNSQPATPDRNGYLQRFQRSQQQLWQQYQQQHQYYYSAQPRWNHSEFWRRRHAVMGHLEQHKG